MFRLKYDKYQGVTFHNMVNLFMEPDREGIVVDGFMRFPLNDSDHNSGSDTWRTAYHGTSVELASKIFFGGCLKFPSEGAVVAHGHWGSMTEDSIYLSPSKHVSAFPAYSHFSS
jgi:hypothetical protein